MPATTASPGAPEPASLPAPAAATLAPPSAGPACFGAFLAQGRDARPAGRARTRMIAVSLAAHGLVVAAGVCLSFWQVDELTAPSVSVTFLTTPLAPPPPPPPPARAAVPKRPRPRPTPTPELVQPRVEPTPQAAAPAPEEQPPQEDQQEQGVDQGVAGGVVGGQVGGTLPPPDPSQRRSLLERYLRELFRSRIAARFRYPPEAEREGIEGVVVMRVAIDGSGKLLELRLVGSCEHTVLCEAASRTLLASAPFPPPPAELGGAIAVDVPLAYRLE